MTTAHEPRRGPGIHLSADDLSALAEGAEPGAAGADEHLASCAACRAEVDAIADLLTAFEELDAPAMPTDVAIRIDAALARESAERAASFTPPEGAQDAAPKPSAARRRKWLSSRGLGWAIASLVVVVGGSTALVNVLSSGGGASSATSASAGSGASGSQMNGAAPNAESSRAPYNSDLTGPAALSTWVMQALGNTHPDASISSPCFDDPAFTGRARVTAVNGTFNGMPATLVVFPNGNDKSTVYAVAYATPCSPGNYRVLSEGVVAK